MSSLISSTGPIDKASAFMGIFFGSLWTLTFAFELEFVEQFMEMGMTLFGTLSPHEPIFPYIHSLPSALGGIWGCSQVASNLSCFMAGESKDIREHRQFINMVQWVGWTALWFKYLVVDEQLGGLMGASFNYVWMVIFVVMAISHVKWFKEGDLSKKMKVA